MGELEDHFPEDLVLRSKHTCTFGDCYVVYPDSIEVGWKVNFQVDEVLLVPFFFTVTSGFFNHWNKML